LRNQKTAALSISDLERLRLFITSTTPVESLRIQLLSQGTSAFLSLDTQRSLTIGNIALKKEHSHLETSEERELRKREEKGAQTILEANSEREECGVKGER
jgi:hypothetical protein